MVQEELVGFNLEGSVCQVSAGDRVGELLAGRYRVLRRLGAGGMGTVYLAEHVHLGRLTAVKVLCPPLCDDDPSAEQRFRQEALLVARVRHPSVAQVYDFDRGPDGQFLLAMEYVEGETVAQRLQRGGPFPLPEAMRALDRHSPPRLETSEHHAGFRGRGEAARLRSSARDGPALGGRSVPARHPRLHEPRTAAGRRHRSRERHLFTGRRVLRDGHGPAPPRGDNGSGAADPAPAAPAHPGALAPPDLPSRIGRGGGASPPSRPSRAVAVGGGLRAGGGAGGRFSLLISYNTSMSAASSRRPVRLVSIKSSSAINGMRTTVLPHVARRRYSLAP